MASLSAPQSDETGKTLVRRASAWAIAVALTVTATGCGSSADADHLPVFPTVGKVSFKGKVPQGAYVALHLKNAPSAPGAKPIVPSGQVKPDGSFELSSYAANDGAPPGDYTVTLEWHKVIDYSGDSQKLGPNLLPAKYSQPQTSPVSVTIVASRNDLPAIVLK